MSTHSFSGLTRAYIRQRYNSSGKLCPHELFFISDVDNCPRPSSFLGAGDSGYNSPATPETKDHTTLLTDFRSIDYHPVSLSKKRFQIGNRIRVERRVLRILVAIFTFNNFVHEESIAGYVLPACTTRANLFTAG